MILIVRLSKVCPEIRENFDELHECEALNNEILEDNISSVNINEFSIENEIVDINKENCECVNAEKSIDINHVEVQTVSVSEERFSIVKLLKTNDQLNSYTGLHSHELLNSVVTCFTQLKKGQGKKK